MPVTSKRTGTGENKPGLKKAPQEQQDTPTSKTYRKDPETGKTVPYDGVVYNDSTPHWKKAEQMHDNTHGTDKSEDPKMPTEKSRPRFSSSTYK